MLMLGWELGIQHAVVLGDGGDLRLLMQLLRCQDGLHGQQLAGPGQRGQVHLVLLLRFERVDEFLRAPLDGL